MIKVGDEEVRYWAQTEWVVLDPQGHPIGCMKNDADIKDHVGKAARRFWGEWGDADPMQKLHDGYRLELVTHAQYRRDYYPAMLGGYRIEHDGRSGIFIPDED